MIAKKVACVLTDPHFKLILCVGEELGIREANKQDAFVSKQLCESIFKDFFLRQDRFQERCNSI